MAKRRKPTRLRLVTGGRTRRHHVAEEVQPDPTMPSPPAWLQGHGLNAWREVAGPLHVLGVLTSLDQSVLAAWASATGMVAEAQEQLNQMPEGNRLLIKRKRGGPLVNPLVGVIRKVQRDAIHYGNLLACHRLPEQAWQCHHHRNGATSMSSSDSDLEAQAARRREELGEALTQLSLAMLRNGASAEFVQRFIDDECERMRRVQRKTHGMTP